MLRDATFTETSRCEAVDEAGADFVMDEETFRAFYDRTARGGSWRSCWARRRRR